MKRGDQLILGGTFCVALLCAALWLWNRNAAPALVAEISSDGVVIETVDLATLKEPVTFRIESHDGQDVNVIRMEPGRAAIVEANCPDELCVRSGWLTRAGQSAVCLPHRLALYLKGESDLDGLSH